MSEALWTIAAVAAGVYCIVRAIGDLKRQRYVAGALALVSALIFLIAPVKTQTVSVTIPVSAR